MARGNPDKLKPVRSKQEASETGRLGGIASGEARRQRKTLKEELLMLLSCINPRTDDTVNNGISTALIKRALNGDVKAFIAIRDTIGEKPVEKVDLGVSDSGELDGIEIAFVNKAKKATREVDPKIMGEYSAPIDVTDG